MRLETARRVTIRGRTSRLRPEWLWRPSRSYINDRNCNLNAFHSSLLYQSTAQLIISAVLHRLRPASDHLPNPIIAHTHTGVDARIRSLNVPA
jgi:hypothetical protein